jgi:hypothetical protein
MDRKTERGDTSVRRKFMRVTLNSETPSRDCGCASLLAHWESAAHHKAGSCSVANCHAPSTEAVLVAVMDEVGPHRYVVPVCHWHAQQKDFDTDLREESRLVSHSALATCANQVPVGAMT